MPEPLSADEEAQLDRFKKGEDLGEDFFPDGKGGYLSMEVLEKEIRNRSELGREVLAALMQLRLT